MYNAVLVMSNRYRHIDININSAEKIMLRKYMSLYVLYV